MNYDIVCKHRFLVANSAISLVKILPPKIRFSMVFAAVLWPTEEKARRKTFYWQSNSDSKLGAYQRTTINSDMDRAHRNGRGRKKKYCKAAQHSEAITCKMQATKATADQESCLEKTKTAFPPGRVTAVVKRHQPGWISERRPASSLPCSQVPACPPRSASNFLYMYVTL